MIVVYFVFCRESCMIVVEPQASCDWIFTASVPHQHHRRYHPLFKLKRFVIFLCTYMQIISLTSVPGGDTILFSKAFVWFYQKYFCLHIKVFGLHIFWFSQRLSLTSVPGDTIFFSNSRAFGCLYSKYFCFYIISICTCISNQYLHAKFFGHQRPRRCHPLLKLKRISLFISKLN